MQLSEMRYKNFVWPHNPRIYSIEYERLIATHKIPFGNFCLQDLGRTRRVMRGSGEFVGENAYSQFGALAVEFYSEDPGMLVHPLWQTADAYFVELKLEQVPQPNYVKYSFVFWESTGQTLDQITVVEPGLESTGTTTASASRKTYTVVSGDNLWAIANRQGLTLAQLIALNPQIKNPNLIYPGEVVFLS